MEDASLLVELFPGSILYNRRDFKNIVYLYHHEPKSELQVLITPRVIVDTYASDRPLSALIDNANKLLPRDDPIVLVSGTLAVRGNRFANEVYRIRVDATLRIETVSQTYSIELEYLDSVLKLINERLASPMLKITPTLYVNPARAQNTVCIIQRQNAKSCNLIMTSTKCKNFDMTFERAVALMDHPVVVPGKLAIAQNTLMRLKSAVSKSRTITVNFLSGAFAPDLTVWRSGLDPHDFAKRSGLVHVFDNNLGPCFIALPILQNQLFLRNSTFYSKYKRQQSNNKYDVFGWVNMDNRASSLSTIAARLLKAGIELVELTSVFYARKDFVERISCVSMQGEDYVLHDGDELVYISQSYVSAADAFVDSLNRYRSPDKKLVRITGLPCKYFTVDVLRDIEYVRYEPHHGLTVSFKGDVVPIAYNGCTMSDIVNTINKHVSSTFVEAVEGSLVIPISDLDSIESVNFVDAASSKAWVLTLTMPNGERKKHTVTTVSVLQGMERINDLYVELGRLRSKALSESTVLPLDVAKHALEFV